MLLQELVTDGVAHLVGDALSGNDWVLECGAHALCFLAERLGSGDGERKTLLTRQIAFEPLPASVLLGVAGVFIGASKKKSPSNRDDAKQPDKR